MPCFSDRLTSSSNFIADSPNGWRLLESKVKLAGCSDKNGAGVPLGGLTCLFGLAPSSESGPLFSSSSMPSPLVVPQLLAPCRNRTVVRAGKCFGMGAIVKRQRVAPSFRVHEIFTSIFTPYCNTPPCCCLRCHVCVCHLWTVLVEAVTFLLLMVLRCVFLRLSLCVDVMNLNNRLSRLSVSDSI